MNTRAPDAVSRDMTLPPEWDALCRAVNNAATRFGDAGVRDPEHPCDIFDPLLDCVKPTGRGDCYGDGHYLCLECSHLSMNSERWPSIDCPECVERGYITISCERCNDHGVIDQPGWERAR